MNKTVIRIQTKANVQAIETASQFEYGKLRRRSEAAVSNYCILYTHTHILTHVENYLLRN